MVPVIHQWRSAGALGRLLLYVTHDPPMPGRGQRDTNDRVVWSHGLNLPTNDPQRVAGIMLQTIEDAAMLKRLAGVSARGKKLKTHIGHLTFSYPRNRDLPWGSKHVHDWSREEVRERVIEDIKEALKQVDLDGCEVLLAAHTDRDHFHVHAVVCRVDPQTGRARGRKKFDAKALSVWARGHELRNHDRTLCNRPIRSDKPQGQTSAEQHRDRRVARRQRSVYQRAYPAVRQIDWNPREKTAFKKLYRRQREDGTDRPTAAAERRQLRTRLERNRRRPIRGLMDALRKEWGELGEGWGKLVDEVRAHRARKARPAESDREEVRREADQRRAEQFGAAKTTPSTPAIQPETITPDPPPVELVPEASADTRDTTTPPRSSDLPLKRRLPPGVAGPQRSGVKPKSTAPPTKRRTPER